MIWFHMMEMYICWKELMIFFEAVWMHKYNGQYYLSYSSKSGEIKYAMSDNPLGPFEYKGIILDKVNSGTNHHSIVEYKVSCEIFSFNI